MSEFASSIKQGLSFIVRNNAPEGKSLKIFNNKILNGNSLDLMTIPGISEDDIRASLVKGELGKKLQSNYLQFISSTIEFESSDPEYSILLNSFGINAGIIGRGLVVANLEALSATSTVGLSEGSSYYVGTLRQNFSLQFDALTLRPFEVIASDNSNRVWVRNMTPSSWTYQFDWYYNKDTGNDEYDGSSSAPIKSLDEFCRRVRVFSAGTATVQKQYTINLQTDVAAADTWFPSGTLQADTVQVGRVSGETQFRPTIVGFRRAVSSVPGGSGLLTAASALFSMANNTKATLIDSTAVLTTFLGQMVMCADTATAASGTGTTATITADSGIVTLTGGTGFTTGSVNRLITISGATTSANNGTFPITEYVSTTSIKYSNPNATATDVSSGAIIWTEKASKVAWITNVPAFTTGTGATVTAVSAGIATLANFPAATFTDDAVGKRIRFTGSGAAGNNTDVTIIEYISDTSVKVANSAAVVDATSMTFQGIVEVGPSWYDNATLTVSAAAPSINSPYVIIQQAIVPQRSHGAGAPQGMVLGFNDCELSTSVGVAAGQMVNLTQCRLTNGGFIAGQAGQNLASHTYAVFCCWRTTTPFTNWTCQENGVNRLQDSIAINYVFQFRETGTSLIFQNTVIQGGYVGLPGEETAGRPGSSFGMTVGMARGLAVYNNIKNSNIHPTVASGSAGFAVILGRNSRGITAGQGKISGIGALGGMHVKENSFYMCGAATTPVITDVAGQAGYAVAQVKIDANAPIPVPSTITGVPTAVTTTAGTATSLTASDGIITVVDAGATFTTASAGRTLTVSGAATGANNGTFPIVEYVGATSVKIRNLSGVTDANNGSIVITENPVITRWAQLSAAPYSGNALNAVNGTSIIRIVEV